MQAVLQGRFVTVTPVLVSSDRQVHVVDPHHPPAPPLHPTVTATGLAELAAICARPLPDIPDHWLTNRWHRGVWSARTDAILTHPAYRDFYTWSAATHPQRHEHWELMAAVAVTHAQQWRPEPSPSRTWPV